MKPLLKFLSVCGLAALPAAVFAEPPSATYIFPAGGQRGTKVAFRIGGMFLHDKAPLEMLGPGITAASEIKRTETTWFEGPLIRQPASQAAENYPKDCAGEVQIAADAALGYRRWRVWSAQGVTPLARFLIGDLPEVVEDEIEGEPIPVAVTLPVTINGRIFPREDVDVWTFEAAAGQSITCSLAAAEFGSPLKGRLEVRSPSGKPLAETTGTTAGDVRLRFVATETGKHEVRVHDIQFGGLQTYVYRLTVTNGPWLDSVYPLGGQRGTEVKLEGVGQNLAGPVTAKVPYVSPAVLLHAFDHSGRALNPIRFDVDELPEMLEAEPNNASAMAKPVTVPAVVNGRIDQPGNRDVWQLPLTKGQAIRIECRAALLGSPLAAEIVLRDEGGKDLARADALETNGDPALNFTAPADGKYTLEVGDKFTARGGPAFAYRIRIAPPKKTPDFELVIPDSLAHDGEGAKNLDVQVFRSGEFKGPITLHVDGLPAGITAEDVKLADGPKGTLFLKSAPNLPVTTALLKVTGSAEVDGKPVQRVAHVIAVPGDVPVEQLRLVTTLKTPFKLRGTYDLRFAARGTVLKKKYLIERGGYEGALEARLADKQGRHLQGVSGPVMTIPPGVNEFEYPLTLAPWMELSRTSRSNLMLTGEVKDSSGVIHKVSFTNQEQNEQLVALVAPGPLRVLTDRKSIAAVPSSEVVVEIQLKRDRSITSPVKLELVVPKHIRDVSAEVVTLPAGTDSGQVRIRIGASPGPFNMPAKLRATAEKDGAPILGESEIELTP